MDFGQVNKQYVSSIEFLDQREILHDILDVTNEEACFLDMLEMTGRMEQTAVPTYHNYVNKEYYAIEEAASAVEVTGNTEITITLKNTAEGKSYGRVTDLVLFQNGMVGYLKTKTPGTPDVITVKSVDGQDLTAADISAGTGAPTNFTEKMVFFSNAAGESSLSPEGRKYDLDKEWNQVQIFKDMYEVSGVQKVSKVEVDFQGKPYYMLKGQYDTLTKFRNDISMGLWVSRISDANFSATTSTLDDSEGNPVQTTKGFNQYVEEKGVLHTTSSGLTVADWKTLTRAMNKRRAPKDFLMMLGGEGEIAVDTLINSFGASAVNTLGPNARFSVDSRNVDLGIDSFKMYGRVYHKKYLPMLDHKNLFNFVGSAGFQDYIYLVPNDKIKVHGSDKKLDRLRLRYMTDGETDMRYTETLLGKYAPIPTNSRSNLEAHYEAMFGLQMLGGQHFSRIKIVNA